MQGQTRMEIIGGGRCPGQAGAAAASASRGRRAFEPGHPALRLLAALLVAWGVSACGAPFGPSEAPANQPPSSAESGASSADAVTTPKSVDSSQTMAPSDLQPDQAASTAAAEASRAGTASDPAGSPSAAGSSLPEGSAPQMASAEAAVTVAVATLTAAALPSPAGTETLASPSAAGLTPAGDGVPGSARVADIAHVYQKWNNCAPSAAVMLLSAFGIQRDQLLAAASLKPDGKDTNVSPEELAAYLRQDGLAGRVIVGADVDLVRRLLAAGLPVIAEQWIAVEGRGEMGHYRVISGYEDGTFLHQDSYYGPNRRLAEAAFDAEWRPFGRAMVLAYPPDQEGEVSAILGPLADRAGMFRAALARAEAEAATIGDAWSHLALAEARARMGDWPGAAAAGDEAMRQGLPFRALWYQFGYYQALHALGRFDDLLARADATLAPMKGEQLEESQYWRGMALRGLGREEEARAAFEAALRYHPGWGPATEALAGGP